MADWKRFSVGVTISVDVELDASKFTPEMMAEFREQFYNFTDLGEHAEHIAQLSARGLIGELVNVHVGSRVVGADEFIEGYGEAAEAGIRVSNRGVVDLDTDEGS